MTPERTEERVKTCKRCGKTKLLVHFRGQRRVRRNREGETYVTTNRSRFCSSCDDLQFAERMVRTGRMQPTMDA